MSVGKRTHHDESLGFAGLRIDEGDVERRRQFVGLDGEDLLRLAAAAPVVAAHGAQYVGAFFEYLARFGETAPLFLRPELLHEAKRLKHAHLAAMVQGEYGTRYAQERLRLAKLYSEARLPVRIFLGAYHHLLSAIGLDLVRDLTIDRLEAFRIFASVRKIGFLDMGIIIDSLLAEREHTIALQQEAIQELSTPVLQLREGLLLLPIIGAVDARRAHLLTDTLLRAIRSRRARVVVVDVTGVAAVNPEVANHLVQSVEAARLIGVIVILSGLSPAVARALIELGVNLSAYDVVGDLQSGIERSEHLLGYRVVKDTALA
jgi:rsbT co-antagonist protein RsbR